MATLRDELAEKTKAKIIELFGPESALAQALEDDDFFDKLADLVAYIYGLVILSQPRPEPRPAEPGYPSPWPQRHPKWGEPWTKHEWKQKWQRTTAPGSFTYKLWSAMSKYERR